MNSTTERRTLGILCGGGPAPGMNSVISSITIEARKNGWDVVGIYDGFALLAQGDKTVLPLTIDLVSRIHTDGGSILRTSRFNPTKDENLLRKVVDTLVQLGITHLATIGGDDTAYTASQVAECAHRHLGLTINLVHIPKTIDNDLPLPEGIPTFGFETARSLGAQLVSNLMEDARTTGRWYLAVAMGRTAGHLALGIGKSAGATITIIPEEFREKAIPLHLVVDILCGSIIKRLASGRNHGVAIVAEGLLEKIDLKDLEAIDNIERDEHGHVRYAEIHFSEVIKNEVGKELKKLGIKTTIVNKEIGYEVRCAPPNAFDIEYTRNLGYAAFEFLRDGGTNAIITIQNNRIVPIPFEQMLDPKTGKTHVRMVNIDSIQYRIARQYMIRLEKRDFDAPSELGKLAVVARMMPEEFRQRFAYVTA